jgi:hypothetical protein
MINTEIYVPAPSDSWRMTLNIVNYCFVPYIKALLRVQEKLNSHFPNFKFGFVGVDFNFDLNQVIIASKALAPELTKIGLPHEIENLEDNWSLLKGGQYLC